MAPTLTPPPSGPIPGGYGPDHEDAVKTRDRALDEYDRVREQWEQTEATADKTDPNYERLRQEYQAYMESMKQQAVAADARAQAIADAAERAKNTRVLRGIDGRDYTIEYDPRSGRWRNTETGNDFDPDQFNRWQQDMARDRQFMAAESEKMRNRQDWFSREMDQRAAEHKARAEAAAYVGRIQQAALKHDLWNPGGPGDVVGATQKILDDIHSGKPIDWQKIGAARKYMGDRITGAAADESAFKDVPGMWDSMKDTAAATAREAITGKDEHGNATLAGSLASMFGRVTAGIATGGASEIGYVTANMYYAQKDAADRGASDWEIYKAGFTTGVLEAGPTLAGGAIGHYFPKHFPNASQAFGEMLEPVGKAVGALDDAVKAGSRSLNSRINRLFNPVPETLQGTRSAVTKALQSGDPSDLAKLYSEGGMDRLAKLPEGGRAQPRRGAHAQLPPGHTGQSEHRKRHEGHHQPVRAANRREGGQGRPGRFGRHRTAGRESEGEDRFRPHQHHQLQRR